ncbi:MAG: single-stranded DNA-binding protein, partial [Lactimicrobium massiliense]
MINRVVLVGRLTKDVEVRKTTTGLSVASFTVACDRRGQKNPDGSSQADFINCTAWRQSADFLGQYARKGAMVGVEGRIQTRSYDDQQGQRRYVTEVVCDNVSLLESRSQSMARAQQTPSYSNNNNSGYSHQSYQQPEPSGM